MITSTGESYLGDGLYGRMEGTMLYLRAPRTGGDDWVGLEPEVLLAALFLVKQHFPDMLRDVLSGIGYEPKRSP